MDQRQVAVRPPETERNQPTPRRPYSFLRYPMSLYYLPRVSDWTIPEGMTVFVNPLLTDSRYRPGLEGVAASMIRLSSVAGGRDWQSISSVLGDMAFCLGIEAAEVPHCEPD